MKPILNQLIQLQELCFALSERKATMAKSQLTELEASIGKMKKQLPADLATNFELLHSRNPLFIAPVVGGACTACRQALPTSLDFSVRTHGEIQHCPNCKRIIYALDGPVRQTKKRVGSFSHTGSGISQYSSRSLMLPQMQAKTREEAIAELAQLMATQGFIDSPAELTEIALRREAIDPTAVEQGLAFPHVRGIEGGGLTVAVGMKKAGLDFGALDGKLTRIIFFTVIPTAASAFYLKLLSGLIQTFRDADARKEMLAAKTPEIAWKALTKLTAATIK